jgi:nitrile hydratase
VAKEGPEPPGQRVAEALLKVLPAKGLVDLAALARGIESLERAGAALAGAHLVARSWVDPAFKARLLEDAAAAALELGIVTTNSTTATKLKVVAASSDTHHLIVCTLCSCYPLSLLGLSPAWYKSRAYRARAVRAPRSLLRECFGLTLADHVAVEVHDSTADLRFLVLPLRPVGTEALTEDELRALVTRDSMIGVAQL